MKTCPYCSEQIQGTAKKCRYCGEWLEQGEAGLSATDSKLRPRDHSAVPPAPFRQSDQVWRVGGSARTTSIGIDWALIVAGGLMILGSFLPWFQEFILGISVDRNGMQLSKGLAFSGDGLATIILGAVVGLIGIAELTRTPFPKIVSRSPILAGAAGLVIGLYDYQSISSSAHDFQTKYPSGSFSIGYGLWLVIAGAGMAVIFGLVDWYLAIRREVPVGEEQQSPPPTDAVVHATVPVGESHATVESPVMPVPGLVPQGPERKATANSEHEGHSASALPRATRPWRPRHLRVVWGVAAGTVVLLAAGTFGWLVSTGTLLTLKQAKPTPVVTPVLTPAITPVLTPAIIPTSTVVPLTVCPTTFGAPYGKKPRLPNWVTLPVPRALGRSLSVYADSADRMRLVAPRGWPCQASYSADGTGGLGVSAPGAIPLGQQGAIEGVTGLQTLCSTCAETQACPLFASAAQELKRFDPTTRCGSIQPGEQIRHVNGNLAEFTDPPGVTGDGSPSGGPFSAMGAMTFSPAGYREGTSLYTCTVPRSMRRVCLAGIQYASQHYRGSASLTPKSSLTPYPPATLSTQSTSMSRAKIIAIDTKAIEAYRQGRMSYTLFAPTTQYGKSLPATTSDGSSGTIYAWTATDIGGDGTVGVTFFFDGTRLVGVFPVEGLIQPSGTGAFDVVYRQRLQGDPYCCPSGKLIHNHFVWNGITVVPSSGAPLPPSTATPPAINPNAPP